MSTVFEGIEIEGKEHFGSYHSPIGALSNLICLIIMTVVPQ